MKPFYALLLLTLPFFCLNLVAQDNPNALAPAFDKGTISMVPYYSGCLNSEDIEEQKQCTRSKINQHIAALWKIPEVVLEEQLKGTVYFSYVIEKDGKVGQFQIDKDYKDCCGPAILEILQLLPPMELPDETQFTSQASERIDYTFDIMPSESYYEKVAKREIVPVAEIFHVVEEMPNFPGCEGVANKRERRECAQRKMLEFIYGNIEYPKEARSNKTEGMVVVRFVVNKKGEITDAQVTRDPGNGCGEEALRVVKLMPDWNPGKQRGKPVNVYFNLPVKFKL